MGYRKYILVFVLAMMMTALHAAADDVGPMADTHGPTIESDRTPGVINLGSILEFNVTVTDETGVNNVSVEYWYTGSGHSSVDLTFISGTPTDGVYIGTIVPDGYVGVLGYKVYANDTLGYGNVTGVKSVQLRDRTRPSVDDFTATLSGRPTTGDSFSFWANVSDNVAISEVRIHYTAGSPPYTDQNVTMVPMSVDSRGNGLYVYNVTTHDNTTDPFLYIYYARDTSNNVRIYAGQANVRDNDKPEIVGDLSDSSGTTGDPFRFEIDVKDNVAIEECRVFWGYKGISPKNQTLQSTQVDGLGNGKYQRVSTLPESFEGEFWYQLMVKDLGGVWNVTDVVDITITDNDRPIVGPDASAPVSDDRFDFEVNVTDNIGIQSVWVVYGFEGEAPSNATLSAIDIDSGGNGTYGNVAVGLPLDRQVRLEYTLGAMDANGFVATISGEYVNRDEIIPWFGANGTAGEPVKGLSVDVWIEAFDNHGISDVRVEYWFGVTAAKNDSMDDMGDTFNYTIFIPREPAGQLHYRFLAADLKGNWNRTGENSMALYNLVPEAVDVPVWEVTEEENDIFDLEPYLQDGNDAVTSLMLTTEAEDVVVSDLRLTMRLDSWTEDFTIDVNVSDGEDESTFTISVTVIDVNDLPAIISEPVVDAAVSVEYVYPIVFTDEDLGQNHTFYFDEAPAGMTVTPNGRISWTPEAGQEGQHSIDLALDDEFNVVHQQWTITVTGRPTDEPPAFTNSPPTTHMAGTDYVFDFEATDPDGDDIIFKIVSGPEGAEIDQLTGELTWDTDADKRDTTDNVDFVVRVSDLKNDVDLEFTVALSYPNNDPPEITGTIPKVKTDRDTSVNLGTYMSDPDDEKIDLEWNATTDAKAFNVHMNGNHLVITIKEGKSGKGTVTLRLEDPWGESDTTEVTVEVESSDEDGGALGGNMLYIAIAVVAVIVVLGLVYMLKGGPKEE
jgi:hypothetical protein